MGVGVGRGGETGLKRDWRRQKYRFSSLFLDGSRNKKTLLFCPTSDV